MLYVHQALPVVDVVAQHDEIGRQPRVVVRGCGVVELEAVVPVVNADVPDEGLV